MPCPFLPQQPPRELVSECEDWLPNSACQRAIHPDRPALLATFAKLFGGRERFPRRLPAGALLGRNKSSIAETSNGIPASARPPYIPPVQPLITPIAYGPTNPPRLATELISPMPAAAENPVRNSPGRAQKGPTTL